MKIIHISDLHYASTRFNSTAMHRPISHLVTKIKDHYSGIEDKPLIVLTGDILASSFREKKSRRARAKLEELREEGFEFLICPGNHDIKDAGLVAVVNGRKKFNRVFKRLIAKGNIAGDDKNDFYAYPMVHKFDDHFFIGLDSMKKQNGNGAKGELGDRQRNKLKKVLKTIREEHSDAKIVVYLHHSPLFHKPSLELIDRKQFLEIIRGVNVLLFGHWHVNKRYPEKEKKYDIDCFINGGDSNIGNIHWWEIDTDDYSAIEY